MAHIPGGPIVRSRVFSKNDSVHLQGADSLLGHQHEIAHLKPGLKRNLGVLKDGTGEDREAVAILSTTVSVLANPMKQAGLQAINFFLGAAARTLNPVRPAHVGQNLFAGVHGVELAIKGIKGFHGVTYELV